MAEVIKGRKSKEYVFGALTASECRLNIKTKQNRYKIVEY